MRPRSRLIATLATALVIGFAYPYLELAWKCRGDAASEACVWGRAYFPLSRWVEPLIVAPIAFAVIVVFRRIFERDRHAQRLSG